jgi:hypothetical protein
MLEEIFQNAAKDKGLCCHVLKSGRSFVQAGVLQLSAYRGVWGRRVRSGMNFALPSPQLQVTAALALIVALAVGAPASAGRINNRSQWEALSESAKESYLAGWNDHTTLVMGGAGPEYLAFTHGLQRCSLELLPRASDMVRLVDQSYARDPTSWEVGPGLILDTEMLRICHAHINAARTQAGLKPLP